MKTTKTNKKALLARSLAAATLMTAGNTLAEEEINSSEGEPLDISVSAKYIEFEAKDFFYTREAKVNIQAQNGWGAFAAQRIDMNDFKTSRIGVSTPTLVKSNFWLTGNAGLRFHENNTKDIEATVVAGHKKWTIAAGAYSYGGVLDKSDVNGWEAWTELSREVLAIKKNNLKFSVSPKITTSYTDDKFGQTSAIGAGFNAKLMIKNNLSLSGGYTYVPNGVDGLKESKHRVQFGAQYNF
jgi:hypothetical protein